jgi:hypothetical protein
MRYIFSLLILLSSISALQAQDISGHWKGRITQNEGGYRSEYILEMWFVQKGDSITGKSYVFVDNIYAEMNISGSVEGEIYLILKDDEIVSHEVLKGMEWCIKKYQLLIRRNGDTISLEGDWQGKTSFSTCIPGKIFLRKIVPRA